MFQTSFYLLLEYCFFLHILDFSQIYLIFFLLFCILKFCNRSSNREYLTCIFLVSSFFCFMYFDICILFEFTHHRSTLEHLLFTNLFTHLIITYLLLTLCLLSSQKHYFIIFSSLIVNDYNNYIAILVSEYIFQY